MCKLDEQNDAAKDKPKLELKLENGSLKNVANDRKKAKKAIYEDEERTIWFEAGKTSLVEPETSWTQWAWVGRKRFMVGRHAEREEDVKAGQGQTMWCAERKQVGQKTRAYGTNDDERPGKQDANGVGHRSHLVQVGQKSDARWV